MAFSINFKVPKSLQEGKCLEFWKPRTALLKSVLEEICSALPYLVFQQRGHSVVHMRGVALLSNLLHRHKPAFPFEISFGVASQLIQGFKLQSTLKLGLATN